MCNGVDHNYKEITESKTFDGHKICNWCVDCGSITVDLEFDNRTISGYYSDFKFAKNPFVDCPGHEFLLVDEIQTTMEADLCTYWCTCCGKVENRSYVDNKLLGVEFVGIPSKNVQLESSKKKKKM